MGFPPPSETLALRASFLRESLQRSQSTTHQMVTKLATFDHRLSALDEAIRPVMVMASSMRRAHENIGKTLNSADAILTRFDVFHQVETKILRGPHNDLEGFITAIDLLRSNVNFFASNKSFKNTEALVAHFNNLLAKAIVKLEEEFRRVLSSHSVSLDPEHLPNCLPNSLEPTSGMPDSSQTPTAYLEHQVKDFEKLIRIPPNILLLLHDLAQQLVHARRQMQCLKIYSDLRAPALEQSLQKLGVERLRKDIVQNMQWEVLEAKIRNWVRFIRIAVKCHFLVERKVCNDIFKDLDSLRDRCFAEVTSKSVQVLFDFAETVTETKIMPEKLFALLDMYKTMQELQSEMETLFEGQACSAMRKSVSNLMRNLSQTIFETLTYFENKIKQASTKAPNDGRVHPMTSYVINYLKYLFDYLSALKQIFRESNFESNSHSQLETVIMQLIQALEINLDVTSKQYKEPALAHIFLMNNIHYIVSFVRGSEAKILLGNDWVDTHRRTVQQNANQYRRVAWAQVVGTLTAQGLNSSGSGGLNSSNTLREAVKERFKSFNMQFDELHQRQSQWVVRDHDLADNLRLSVTEILLPAYRSFTQRFGPLVDNTKYYDRLVKYSPEAIERMVGELFQGRG